MTQQPVTFQQVTVSEAADILGVSTQTVRRMIRRGQLEGERVHRAQGSAYVVRLPDSAAAGDMDATATQQPSPNVSRSNATDQPAPAEAMVSLIQTTIGTVLGPLVGELAASRQTIERQAEQLVGQAETIGRQSAELERAAGIAVKLSDELDTARAQISTLEARATPQSAEPAPGPFSGRLHEWIAAVVAVLAIVAVVVLLVWRW